MEIRGSPFYPEVYDITQVVIGDIPNGLVGDLVEFEGQFTPTT